MVVVVLLLWCSNVTICWTSSRSIKRKWRRGLCKSHMFKVTWVVLMLRRLLRLVMVVVRIEVLLVFFIVVKSVTAAQLLL